MTEKATVLHQDDVTWESFDNYKDTPLGRVRWKTLLSSDRTASTEITMGMVEIPPGEQLRVHYHPQAETYYIFEGEGFTLIDGEKHEVRAGSVVFIPGNDIHTIAATGKQHLKLVYSFPVDAFSEVTYKLPE